VVNAAQTIDQLLVVTENSVADFGFDYFSCYVRKPMPSDEPRVVVFDRYPAGWMAHYHEMGYLACDPTIISGSRYQDIIPWSDELFAGSPHLWTDAQSVGLNHGIAQSSWASDGSYALFSLARETISVQETELARLRLVLAYAASAIHARLELLLVQESAQSYSTGLTPREREVLLWSAEGKTAADIAERLGLNSRSVTFHITNAMKKLNAANKTQAVVNAIGLGVI